MGFCSLFDFWGKESTTRHRGKNTLKDDCTLDSAVSELRNVRIGVSAQLKLFGIAQCRHCQGSGLTVGGGNAGQPCLLLSHEADPLCCRRELCVSSSQFFCDFTKWLNN